MSDVIPKEKQTAYQRWELASFGDDRPSQARQHSSTPASSESIAAFNAQLARAREEARQKGLADGLAEGRAIGLKEGRAQAMGELSRLRQIAETFGNEVASANESIGEHLLVLALDIAKAMLKTALTVKPELVLPVIGEAVRYLPGLQQPAILFLNPEDTDLVKESMGDELTKAGWRVTPDTRLERGGCRIETASNQIDASLNSRWERIASTLGKESDWLEK